MDYVQACNSPPVVLFLPTNGAGLGHLTRCLGLAKRMRRLQPSIEIVFLSTSPAIQLILQEGFTAYYIPSRMTCPEYVGAVDWNQMLYSQLSTIIKLHKPRLLIFDGVFPYSAIPSAAKQFPELRTVWVQRKKKQSKLTEGREKLFNQVIIPGEITEQDVEKDTGHYFSDPFIALDSDELVSRDLIRKYWRIPWRMKLVYVQLGAGNINNISPIIEDLHQIFQRRKDCYLVLGESVISKAKVINKNHCMVLRDYPNARFFKAFDLAISACGYNTFHELLYFGVPSILIPNEQTVSDDQVARATAAHQAGAAIMLQHPDASRLEQAIKEALSADVNQYMRNAAQNLVKKNGADDAAQYLLELLDHKGEKLYES